MERAFRPGRHLIVEHWGGRHLRDAAAGERALRGAARAAGAVVIDARFHGFPGRGGYTGVLLLAESHATIHTWPELRYAALDLFLCGGAGAEAAATHLERAFAPERATVRTLHRGPPEGAAAPHSNHSDQPAS